MLRHIHGLPPTPYGSELRFEVAEYPVELHGQICHVDFVLGFGEHYLVAECKRADPALATWCFAQTPYVRLDERRPYPVFTAVVRAHGSESIVDDMPHRLRTEEPVYHVAAELRTGMKGDGTAGGRQAIDQAVTQVFRSAGGWVEMLKNEGRRMLQNEPRLIAPAIFTTAKLFVTDADLGGADIATGTLGDISVIPKDWIWFQVHLSRQLLPLLRPNPIRDDPRPSGFLLTRHARAVAIVNVAGIQAFLASLGDEDFSPERL